MRVKRKNTLADYIISRFILILFLVAGFTVFCIYFFTSIITFYDTHIALAKQSRMFLNQISMADGKLVVDENYVNHDIEGLTRVVVTDKGEILYGQYPEESLSNISFQDGVTRKVRGQKDSYYLNELHFSMKDTSGNGVDTKILVRSFVKTSDMVGLHYRLRTVSYICMFLVILSSLSVLFIMINRINKPLNKLNETADQFVLSQDLSKRIEIDEKSFYEINAIAQANNAMMDLAERMVATQKKFSSDVAHELRTPISVIIAECQYAGKYIDSKEDMKKALEVINEQAQKTNKLITQIFELTRLENDQMKLQIEQMSIVDILTIICENEPILAEKEIEVQYDLIDYDLMVDLNLIMVAFRNLISNAAKFSDPHSLLILRNEIKEDEMILYFEDHGCGIAQEDLNNIFQRFYQADESRSSEGLGLGLSITNRIIEIHHGSIEVVSEKGVGTTFTVTLPLVGQL